MIPKMYEWIKNEDRFDCSEQITPTCVALPVMLASGRQFDTWGVPVKMNEQLGSRTLRVPGADQDRDGILAALNDSARERA